MYCLRTHIVDDGTRKRTRPDHTMTATSDRTPASAQLKERRSPRRNTGAVTRLLRRLVTGTIAAAVLTLAGAGAGTASAHPTLLVTDPAGQSAVDTSPALITLVFNESVTFGRGAIVLLDA